jgi:hypothetical protein
MAEGKPLPKTAEEKKIDHLQNQLDNRNATYETVVRQLSNAEDKNRWYKTRIALLRRIFPNQDELQAAMDGLFGQED